MSCKVEVVKNKEATDFDNSNKPIIYAFWHGRIFTMGFLNPKHRKTSTIISRHGDGELISHVLKYFNSSAVRGSTNRINGEKGMPTKNRGGIHAIRESTRILEQGGSLVVTPDGPRGPRHKAKKSIISIASKTNTPILQMSFSCSRPKVFSSWDKFMLPTPFSKIKIEYGELKYIPAIENDEELEHYCSELEKQLINLTEKLDKEFGIEIDNNLDND